MWPLPDTAYTLHLEVMPSFPSISAGSDSIDLAPNYIKALEYELAYMWAPEFKLHDSFPLIKEGMLDAQAWVKRINAQDRPVMESPVKYVGNRVGSGFFFNLSPLTTNDIKETGNQNNIIQETGTNIDIIQEVGSV